jgi:hypothetical protein
MIRAFSLSHSLVLSARGKPHRSLGANVSRGRKDQRQTLTKASASGGRH